MVFYNLAPNLEKKNGSCNSRLERSYDSRTEPRSGITNLSH